MREVKATFDINEELRAINERIEQIDCDLNALLCCDDWTKHRGDYSILDSEEMRLFWQLKNLRELYVGQKTFVDKMLNKRTFVDIMEDKIYNVNYDFIMETRR